MSVWVSGVEILGSFLLCIITIKTATNARITSNNSDPPYGQHTEKYDSNESNESNESNQIESNQSNACTLGGAGLLLMSPKLTPYF